MEQASGGSDGRFFLRFDWNVALDAPREAERGDRRSKDGIYSPARGGGGKRRLGRTGGGAGGCGNIGMGDGSGDGGLSAIVIGRMNLDERIAEVAQFHSDGSIGGGDGFLFATEGSTFNPLEAKTKGGGFAEYQRGKVFRIFGKGEDGEEISGTSFFHQEGKGGGVERSRFHQAIDGVGEVFAGDIIQMSSDFDDRFLGRGG